MCACVITCSLLQPLIHYYTGCWIVRQLQSLLYNRYFVKSLFQAKRTHTSFVFQLHILPVQSRAASTGSIQHSVALTLDPASSNITEKTSSDEEGLTNTPMSEEVISSNETTSASDGGGGNELPPAVDEDMKVSDLQVQEEVISVRDEEQETDQMEVDAGPYFRAPRPPRRVSLLEYKERMKGKKKLSSEEEQQGEGSKELAPAVEGGEDLEDPLPSTQSVKVVAALTPAAKDQDVSGPQLQSVVNFDKADNSKEMSEEQSSRMPPSDPSPASDGATMKQGTIEWSTTASSGKELTDKKSEDRETEVDATKLPKKDVQVEGTQPARESREKIEEKETEDQDKERQSKNKERAKRIEELERERRKRRDEAQRAIKTAAEYSERYRHKSSPSFSPGQPRFTIPVHHGPRYNRPPPPFPLPHPHPPPQRFMGFPPHPHTPPYHQAPPVPFTPPPPPPPPPQADVWSMFGSLFAKHNLFPAEDPPPPPPRSRSPSPPLPPLRYNSPRRMSPSHHSSPSHQVLPPRLSSPPPSSSTSLSPCRKSNSPEPSPFHPRPQPDSTSPVSKALSVQPKPSQLDAKQFRIIRELIKKTTVIKSDVSVQTTPPQCVSEGVQSGSGFRLYSTALQVNVRTSETSTDTDSHPEIQHRYIIIINNVV